MMQKHFLHLVVAIFVVLATGATSTQAEVASAKRIPLIYGTDLFHPYDDPDDHFDIATVFALEEFEIKAILLDLGDRQKKKPGEIPLKQMFRLTGREVPFATGLSERLATSRDKGFNQPQEDQAAVELLLETLRRSDEPVVVMLTGSCRDVCAAYNREPQLLKEKIARLYINIGSYDPNLHEWNVGLDSQSFLGIINAPLPIYWCPCLPKNGGTSTHWTFRHHEVLRNVAEPLVNFFVYAIQMPTPQELDPLAMLTADTKPWQRLVMRQHRNMWCTGPIIHAAGRKIYQVGDRYIAAKTKPKGGSLVEIFDFAAVEADTKIRNGRVHTLWKEVPKSNLLIHKVTQPKIYGKVLKSCLKELLEDFPISEELEQ